MPVSVKHQVHGRGPEQSFEAGCITLPARFGTTAAARIVAPFLVFPFLLLPVFTAAGLLDANLAAMAVLGLALAAYGAWTAWTILRDPGALAVEANHPSWKHMYLLMLTAHIGTAAAYWL